MVPIGNRGGLLKASTGYAYARIQRDSAAIARSLVRDGHPFDRPKTRARHRFLDATLLELIRTDPRAVEVAFAELFSRNPADLVLRFLDEDTTVTEEVRLLRTLPPRPFLRAAAGRLGLLGSGWLLEALTAVDAADERPDQLPGRRDRCPPPHPGLP